MHFTLSEAITARGDQPPEATNQVGDSNNRRTRSRRLWWAGSPSDLRTQPTGFDRFLVREPSALV